MRCVPFTFFQCCSTKTSHPEDPQQFQRCSTKTIHPQGPQQISSDFGFRIFSYEELRIATRKFATQRMLGEGGFGIVFYGKLEDECEVAVKFSVENDKTMKYLTKEIEVLGLLRHPHLVSLFGYCPERVNKLILVYEYMSNGDLAFHLHPRRRQTQIGKRKELPWLTRLNIAIQTASALAYLHNSGIIHRDVKTSNILLDENLNAKVADFGLSRFLPLSDSQGSSAYATHASTAPIGTNGYMDPEYIATGRVSDKSDVYGFGVVLFELISSRYPITYEGEKPSVLAEIAMNLILHNLLEKIVDPSLLSDSDNKTMEMITAVAELAFQCVQRPKELRPSMKQVLETLEGITHGTWGFHQMT